MNTKTTAQSTDNRLPLEIWSTTIEDEDGFYAMKEKFIDPPEEAYLSKYT
jgi:hypothetical protein